MHQCCALLLLTLALTAPDAGDAGLIYGGREAVPHSRPYMALVERKTKGGSILYCGGFLLSDNFVMTAAHCQAISYSVILGLHNFHQRKDTVNIPVEQAFIRKDYDSKTLTNDLLLLKLSSNAELNPHVMPIAVAGPDDVQPHSCSVSGWGRSEKYPSNLTPVLMEVNVTLSPEYEDGDFYCCVGRKGVGTGDSGGPLVCEDGKAYGVVTGVIQLKEPEHLFSKIPKHKEWVDSIMNS